MERRASATEENRLKYMSSAHTQKTKQNQKFTKRNAPTEYIYLLAKLKCTLNIIFNPHSAHRKDSYRSNEIPGHPERGWYRYVKCRYLYRWCCRIANQIQTCPVVALFHDSNTHRDHRLAILWYLPQNPKRFEKILLIVRRFRHSWL